MYEMPLYFYIARHVAWISFIIFMVVLLRKKYNIVREKKLADRAASESKEAVD